MIRVVTMLQVTLLVLDKDLSYPLLLSVNLLFNTAVVASQETGTTSVLPSPSPTPVVNEED